MLKFSAAKMAGNTKVAYKNYDPVECEMYEMGDYLKSQSISSYIYGEGETDKGEWCRTLKAGRSVIDSGNMLMFDIDNNSMTFDQVCERLTEKGVESFVTVSKRWTPEFQKLHILVRLDQNLPLDGREFKHLWLAAEQWLGFDSDKRMSSWTQQMAPHKREDVPSSYLSGAAMVLSEVLGAYVEPVEESGAGQGITEYLTGSEQFILSHSEQTVGVAEMDTLVHRHGKQRVHCLRGIEHRGTKDTAFVTTDSSGRSFYFCSGGRCEDQGAVGLISPYATEASLPTETVDISSKDIWTLAGQSADLLAANAIHRFAVAEDATDGDRERAMSAVCAYILGEVGARVVNDELMVFGDTQWSVLFEDESQAFRFIRKVCQNAGWFMSKLADSDRATANIRSMMTKIVPQAKLRDDLKRNFLNLENCVLHIGQGIKVLPHHPAYLFTHTLPYQYDETAECPTWEAAITKIMCSDESLVTALQDALGYLMLREFNVEKMVGFVGGGANGKSTVHRVLKMLVGRHGYSAVPIKQLVKDGGEGAYARAVIVGKLINMTNELTPATLEADAFKDLISGEDITARHPYGRPFLLDVVPKQLVNMNKTDNLVRENSHGFRRRLHLIPFNYTIKESDYDEKLMDKLEAELSGIMNWVLEGAKRVMANKGMYVAPAMSVLLAGVVRDANPIEQFMDEHVQSVLLDELSTEEKLNAVIKPQQLFEAYVDFCKNNNYKPLGRNKFLSGIEELGLSKVESSVGVEGKRVKLRGYVGYLVTFH